MQMLCGCDQFCVSTLLISLIALEVQYAASALVRAQVSPATLQKTAACKCCAQHCIFSLVMLHNRALTTALIDFNN